MPASRYARSAARRVVSVWLPSQLAWPISTPFDGASCRALIVTMSRLPSDAAISGVVTIAHAAPSLTPQQSYVPSG